MERYDDKSSMALVPATERTVSFESVAEFSLPEYLGEVGKLLWVRPTVQLPNGFLSAGTAEYAGRVTYRVLFVGTDGKLYGTEQEENYSFSLPCEAAGLELISVLPQVDAVISRVMGPRKISVRCRMHAEVMGYVEKNLAPDVKGAQGPLCHLGGVAEGGRFASLRSEMIELGEEIALEDDAQVVFTNAEVYLPEVDARVGEARCRGEVVVTLVLSSEAGTPYALARRLPFDTVVEGEMISSGSALRACGAVCDLRAVKGEGRLALAVSFILSVEMQESIPVTYLKDAFLPGSQTECGTERTRIFCGGECGNVHFSVSGRVKAETCGMPRDAIVLASLAEGEVRDKRQDARGITVSGEICCHILYKNGEELGAAGMSVPFSVRTDGAFESLSLGASVPSCLVGRQGDELVLDAELMLALRACNGSDLTRVREIETMPLAKGTASDIEICYPSRGESLWDVARRYAISPEELAISNGIASESYDLPLGTTHLLIP